MGLGDFSARLVVSGTTTNGDTMGSFDITTTFSSIAQFIMQPILVPITTPVPLFTKGAAVAGATLSTMNFFAFKNTGANVVEVGVLTATDAYYNKVGAGEFWSLPHSQIDVNTSAGTSSTFLDIVTINAKAITGASQCSFVAF